MWYDENVDKSFHVERIVHDLKALAADLERSAAGLAKSYYLDELRLRLMAAKERLALERLNIFQLCPHKKAIDRSAYGFVYMQAERSCLVAIKDIMDELDWLPVRLDTSAEINADTRERMTRWIRHGENIAPGEEVFGNAFVHAVTRCAMLDGMESAAARALVGRIAALFRDLTCLMAAVHCANLCNEMQVEQVELSAPHDLARIAMDMTLTTEALLMMIDEDSGEEDDGDYEEVPVGNENHQRLPDYLRLVPDAPPQPPEQTR